MPSEEHAHQAKEEMKKHGDELGSALEGAGPGTGNRQQNGAALEPPIEMPKDVTPRDQKG